MSIHSSYRLSAGFSLLGWGGGGSFPPLAKNLLISPRPPGKILPPPTKGSSSPLNKNFLNGQNYFSSDSHQIPTTQSKNPPHCTALHCTAPQSTYSLKLFRKLYPTSFQSLNESFISNQRPISM